MPAEKISRYKIKAELGQGGMATVYLAYDPMFDRDVALKVLSRESVANAQARERFEREIKIIAKLEHPAIVPVHDVGKDNDRLFFVMRHMPGGSLSDLMEITKLTLKDAARILQRVAAALDYAHAKGVIHRDLKPGNILFDEDGNAFISDFGIAKYSNADTKLTTSGVVGTPTYMSPEQAMGENIDERSDIYSLGVILFEMLSGKLPYEATTPLAMVVKHVNAPIPHLRDTNPDIPLEIDNILQKALAKNRIFRYTTAMEMANELIALLPEGLPPAPEYTPKRKRTSKMAAITLQGTLRKPTSPRGWILGGLVVLAGFVLVLGGSRFLAGSISPTQTPVPSATVTLLAPTAPPSATPTVPPPTPTIAVVPPAATLTATPSPGVGGADKIALLANNDIYVMDVDGGGLFQITNDDKAKLDLQWLPSGQDLLYIQSGCVYIVNVETQKRSSVTCFDNFFQFEGFRVSPDGKLAAVSIDRRMLVVPFDLEVLAAAHTRYALEHLNNVCLVYTAIAAKGAAWSADGQKLAMLFQSAKSGRMAEFIRVMDVHRCGNADPLPLDEFPGRQFTPAGYSTNPMLPAYSWDGNQLFLLNTFKRNEGYGDLFLYDMATSTGRKINPVDNTCCYRDAQFSPDGKYIFFVFQDLRLGEGSETQLYYLPLEELGSGKKPTLIRMPSIFFTNPRERVQPVLRHSIP
jgi:serine/threonine protein kinase